MTEDLLGLFEKSPKFVKRYENLRYKIQTAAKKYRSEVIKGVCPGKSNIYN